MSAYPPLKSLIVLDAAMRTGSFSMAAKELCLTPGAVGQQIQKLEEWLGVLLFTRQIRQVLPTSDGLAYWQRIHPALAQILDASRTLKESRHQGVRLSMPPSFAAKWFTRRMAKFLAQYPEVELRLNSSVILVDFEREQIDLAIRYFDGNDSTLAATLLYQDEARVYCSPKYFSELSIVRPDDLIHATLLHTTIQPYWSLWLKRFSQLDDAQIAKIPGIHFNQSMMAIEASKQGQGVVMAGPLLVEDEIANGMLIELFGHYLPLNAGYFIVHPRKAVLRKAAENLKAWLIAEACGKID